MKKIALLLSVVLLFTSFQFQVIAASEPTFFINSGFADIATYGDPAGVAVSGKNYVAKVVPGGSDKAVVIKNGKRKVSAVVTNAATASIYYIQTAVKLDDNKTEKKLSFNIGSSKVEILKFAPGGKIQNSAGGNIRGYQVGKWIDLGFKVDTESGKCDLYIDGRPVQSRITTAKGKIASIVFDSAATDPIITTEKNAETGETVETETEVVTSWQIDYVRTYTHNKLLGSKEIKYESNSEVVPDVSLDLAKESKAQSQLILGYDFEEDVVGAVPDGFWTKNAPYIDEREDFGGKAFKVERADTSVSGENFIDLLINGSLNEAVVEADIYNPSNGNSSKIFTLRDKPGNFATLLNMSTDGSVKTSNGIAVAKGLNKNWVNIAVALDFATRTYSVYANRELVATEVPIPNANTEDYIQLIRFEMTAGGNKGTTWYDNMYVYTGSELQPFAENAEKEREAARLAAEEEERLNGPKGDPVPAVANTEYFTEFAEDAPVYPNEHLGTYDSAKEMYKDAFVLAGRTGNVMIDGKKYSSPTPVLYENSDLLVPVRTLGAAYGLEIGWDAETGSVTMGDEIKFKAGDTSFEYKGKTVELNYPVKVHNGTTYIELRSFAEKVLNNYVYIGGAGLGIVSAQKLSYQNANGVLRYIMYDRPNANTLYTALTTRYPEKNHPRLVFTKEEFDQKLALSETDPDIKKWSDNVIKTYQGSIKDTKANLPFMEYDSAGLRLQHLVTKSTVMGLYWCWRKTGDDRYAERALNVTRASCTEYTEWGHTTHFLEVGETMAGVAMAYDLFYDILTPEDKELFANKIVNYGLKPAKERLLGKNPYNGLHWPTNPNNWNIVVNKGVIMAALAIADEYETDLCMEVLEYSLRSVEWMMSTYAPEGAWAEGPSYWDYTVSNNVIAIKALESSLGTDYGIGNCPGFLETGYFPFNMSGNAGMYAYHDSPRVYKMSGSAEVFYLAKRANDSSLAGLQLYTMNKEGTNGGITHIMYYDPSFATEAAGLDVDKFYSSSQVASVRTDWSANAVWLGIHAGANDQAHGHVDAGSFEYEADGVRFASEMGKDDYNLPGYWNTSVRNLYVTRAEGHNLYVINPDMEAGQEPHGKTTITPVAAKEAGSIYTVDMTPLYAADVSKATRGFMLSEHRRVFTLQDEIVPKGNDEYYWFWHTVADIDISEDGRTVTLTNGSRVATLYFDSNVEFKIEKGLSLPLPTSPVVDGQLGGLKATMNKITVRFKSETDKPITFRATAIPGGCDIVPDETLVPIAEWSIPDEHEALKYTLPTAIKVDGVAIEGFNTAMTSYDVPVYKVPDVMPTVSVEGVPNAEITQPTFTQPTAVIKIPSDNDPRFFTNYFVNINISTSLTKPTTSKLTATNIEVSAIPEPENSPPNMQDGNFNSRWSAEGEQWAVFDLGEIKSINALGIAIYQGLARSHKFEILVSEDGEDYTSIIKVNTSKLTSEAEYIEFSPVSARFVKLNNFGNSANAWNSITEVEIYGQ